MPSACQRHSVVRSIPSARAAAPVETRCCASSIVRGSHNSPSRSLPIDSCNSLSASVPSPTVASVENVEGAGAGGRHSSGVLGGPGRNGRGRPRSSPLATGRRVGVRGAGQHAERGVRGAGGSCCVLDAPGAGQPAQSADDAGARCAVVLRVARADAARAAGFGVSALARELARLPGVTQRLLALHVSDGRGRCRACTTPGTGLPGAEWPCALHFYASAAEDVRQQLGEERRTR